MTRTTAAGIDLSPAAVAVRRLLDSGLLTLAETVHQGVSAVETSVSHRSFQVSVGDRPKFFVKQSDPVRSQGRDLRVEAAFYRLAASRPDLVGVVPVCRLVSADDRMIVLDAVPGTNWGDRPRAERDPDPDGRKTRSVLRRYGSAVARVHRVRPPTLGRPPWLLEALERASSGYVWLPDACRLLLLRVASSPEFRAGFSSARRAWRATSLVHGDLRWANVLIAPDAGAEGVWLIDWELACRGDPAWDVGSVLADLLVWDDSVPWSSLANSRNLDFASAFLDGYRRQARLAQGPWIELLRSSLRLAAVRLVQTLVEQGHADESSLPAAESALLPLALELLGEPPRLINRLAQGASATEGA